MKITKLPSGNYRALIYEKAIIENGKKKRKYKSITAKTRKEVQIRAAEFLAQKESAVSKSLRAACADYIAAKKNVLSPVTIREYERITRCEFQSIMEMHIDKIRAADLQIAVNESAKTHAPKSVRNFHGFICSVIRFYRPSFVADTRLPQKVKKSIRIPTEEEIKKIYEVCKNTPMEVPFLLASQCGMREGEIAGLERKNVDLKKCEIHVVQSLAFDGKNWFLKSPKTYAGTRTIPCNPKITEIIKNTSPYRKIIDADLVCGLNCDDITHRWFHLVRSCNIEPFNFHILRHYFASQAILQGIPKEYIIELMGHENAKMLDEIYAHTFADKKRAFAEKMTVLADNFI